MRANASLRIANGAPVKVVTERLGHKKVNTTMEIYVHVLPGMQQAAADQLGAQLHEEAKLTGS